LRNSFAFFRFTEGLTAALIICHAAFWYLKPNLVSKVEIAANDELISCKACRRFPKLYCFSFRYRQQ